MKRLRFRRWGPRTETAPKPKRRLRLRRGIRRAGVKLMRKATGKLRSELKQFEREPYLAPF